MNEIRIPSGRVNIEFPAETAMDVNGEMAEALSTVGNSDNSPPVDGIFAAECILKKRTRKVRNLLSKPYHICDDFRQKCFPKCEFSACVFLTG